MTSKEKKDLREGYVPSKKPVSPGENRKKGYVPPSLPQKPRLKPGDKKK